MTACLRGPFLEHALTVQRAQGKGAITTVRMLCREIDQHRRRCTPCGAAWAAQVMASIEAEWNRDRQQALSLLRKHAQYSASISDGLGWPRRPGVGRASRILVSFEKEGLCKSYWDQSTSGPGRRYYELTEKGLAQP